MNTEERIERLKEILNKVGNDELTELVYDLIEERDNLIKMSNIDPLTGVYNRGIIPRIRSCDVLLICDIDDFKTINDTYGHQTGGDYVLKSLGAILSENTRSSDYVCRLGGDEFAVVFTNCDYNFIKERCEKIRQEVANRIKFPNHTITLSMGIAINYGNESFAEMYDRADKALYQSKENGKDQATIYGEQNGKII